MKALKIISIIIVLILVIIAAFVGYSCYAEYSHQKDIDKFISDASKNTRMALVDAYNQQDREKVVGYGMALNFMVQFDASRSHIIPFAEYLRVLENGLDMNAIAVIAEKFREDNPHKNILFDCMTEDKELLFSVLEMPNDIWEFTERKHVVSYDEYLHVCEKL